SPALPAGSYLVALRGPGPLKDHESIQAAGAAPGGKEKQGMRAQDAKAKSTVESAVYPTGFETGKRNLVFYDKDRRIVGSVHVEEAEFVVPGHTAVEIADAPSGDATSVKLRVNSMVKVSNKAVGFTIPLVFAKGEVTADWRH
ncbi:MAG TPA: hypothetical protein VK843_14690, partial [Planctomycetota bacterium]|nr:hypothetical protein [Planctomycetota bacterium]